MLQKFITNFYKSIEVLDPDRIYVENMRSVLNTNTRIAKIVCNLAVRKGYFKKFYAIQCRNESCGRVIESFESLEGIPSEISCYICKDDGAELSTFKKEDLIIVPYYKYIEGTYQVA